VGDGHPGKWIDGWGGAYHKEVFYSILPPSLPPQQLMFEREDPWHCDTDDEEMVEKLAKRLYTLLKTCLANSDEAINLDPEIRPVSRRVCRWVCPSLPPSLPPVPGSSFLVLILRFAPPSRPPSLPALTHLPHVLKVLWWKTHLNDQPCQYHLAQALALEKEGWRT